jgi:rod shape-determining protein MreC
LPAQKQSRAFFDPAQTAEWLVLFMLVWLVGGPLSGVFLSAHAWISAIIARGQIGVQSTKNLAAQVLVASDRIKKLEEKLAQSQLEIAKLRGQAKDTNKLRALLNLKSHAARKAIAADIISRSPDNWFEQVVLDKGSADGVRKGSAVITGEGVVGQVISVSDKAAVVRLLTDPDQKIGVLIPRIGVTGTLSGRHQNSAVIDFVPIGTKVDLKDQVVSLGKSGTFPENHPVGTVVGVGHDTNATTAQIEVKLSENCYDLTQVLVLPPLDD